MPELSGNRNSGAAVLQGKRAKRAIIVPQKAPVRRWYGFHIAAYVVMPEHRSPAGD
jgi:hypothetical protein